MINLNTAVTRYPSTEALYEGEVTSPDGEVSLELADFGPTIVGAFRKMLRDQAFDLSEMGVTTFIPGLDSGVPFYGLPIFPTRNFGFGAVMVNADCGIESPADLAGKRIAVRTYTVTAAVWCRAVLAELYGVDPSSVTWVINDYEHLADFAWPDNVEYREGADLGAMLEAGEVVAGMGIYRGSAPHIVPLFDDPAAVEQAWYDKTGVYPIHHLMIVRRELVEQMPGLPQAITAVFTASKERFLAKLAAGEQLDPAAEALAKRRSMVGPDPVPYGLEANRVAIEALFRYSREQQLLRGDFPVEALFVPGVA